MTPAPAFDQLEVCTFGPGYGECHVVHLGNNNWMVIDSCVNSRTKRPAALSYLDELGVDYSRVRLVVATHWHDDHVKGMAEQLRAFTEAKFCSSPALTRSEFVSTIVTYDSRHGIVTGSGVSELCEVLEVLKDRKGKSTPVRAAPARCILRLTKQESGHDEVLVHTLSPSDKQIDNFLIKIGSMVPLPLATKRRASDYAANDVSIALQITVGDQALIFGADLEETGDPECGWSAVVGLNERPKLRAHIFKVPHHGSVTAHHDGVWSDLLTTNPIAFLTPWNRSRGLPTASDVARLNATTHSAFSTSKVMRAAKKFRPYTVEKQIKETVGSIRPAIHSTGWIRIKNGGNGNAKTWGIELSDEACHLLDWAS